MLTLTQLKEKVNGISFVMVTPFKENGDVDYDGYRKNVRFLVDKILAHGEGINCSITPCGSSGEFPLMSHDECKEVIKICVDEVAGQVPVIAGTGAAGTKLAVEMSKYAQSVGADGVQVITPYYFVPHEEGMYRHYEEIAKAIDIGIVVYNNPAFSKCWIDGKLMRKMTDNFSGKICGVKENTPHLMLFSAMVKAMKGSGVPVQSGFGEVWYGYQFPWGADGFVSPFGNFYPEYSFALYRAAQENDVKKVVSIVESMQPYYDFVAKCNAKRKDVGVMIKPGGAIYGEGNLRFAITKNIMNLKGLNGGSSRLPLIGLEEDEQKELAVILKQLHII